MCDKEDELWTGYLSPKEKKKLEDASDQIEKSIEELESRRTWPPKDSEDEKS